MGVHVATHFGQAFSRPVLHHEISTSLYMFVFFRHNCHFGGLDTVFSASLWFSIMLIITTKRTLHQNLVISDC